MLKQEEGDELCLVTYQIGNSLTTQEHSDRTKGYYNEINKPRFYVDGSISSTNYPTYDQLKSAYESRQAVPSPATIVMVSSCPQSQGSVDITITNTSSSEIIATLQVCLTEHIYVTGMSGQERETWTVRDMLPDAKGESITIAAGASVTKKRSFTVASGWKKNECKLAAFIQGADKEILQGCTAELNQVVSIQTSNTTNIDTIMLTYISGSYMVYVPFKGKCIVSILDIQGRVIQSSLVGNGGQLYQIGASLPNGIYIIRAESHDRELNRKFWVVR